MERKADILLDATVVRNPESGVQRAVRREAEELLQIWSPAQKRRSISHGIQCTIFNKWKHALLPQHAAGRLAFQPTAMAQFCTGQ